MPRTRKSRVLCRFFAHGSCLKEEHCEFSHDSKDRPNNVCSFYQKGACAFGSRCRYEHVEVSIPVAPPMTHSEFSRQTLASELVSAACPRRDNSAGETSVRGVAGELSASNQTFFPPAKTTASETSTLTGFTNNLNVGDSRSADKSDLVICSLAAAGSCPYGENCPHIHGDICPTCGKQCLHPFRPNEREEHIKACNKKQKQLEALKRSEEIECSVCLERVHSKPAAAERNFGLLSECDHPFCIVCIRNWRRNSPSTGMDVNSALRSCPICRKLSYFVIPSRTWYSTKEEKQEIVDNYKAKLRSIDCKHFKFGKGTCPFGSSCFYKHHVREGSSLRNNTLGIGASSGDVQDYGADSDELDNYIGYDSEDGSIGDDIAYAYLASEALAFSRMFSGLETSDEEEPDDAHADDDSDDGSVGDALADAYLAAEMMAFAEMFRNE